MQSFAEAEKIHRSRSMSKGRQNNKNNTDIIFLYKILYYLSFHGTVESKWYLASKSGSGNDKTPRLLNILINKNIIEIVYKNDKVSHLAITDKGKSLFFELEHLLNELDTNIITDKKKQELVLSC